MFTWVQKDPKAIGKRKASGNVYHQLAISPLLKEFSQKKGIYEKKKYLELFTSPKAHLPSLLAFGTTLSLK